MAEYYLSYGDMYRFLEDNINNQDEYIDNYKAEVLTALTSSVDNNIIKNIPEIVSLWDNQLLQSSQLLMGTRYIRVNEAAICFISVALGSGFLDALIGWITTGNFDLTLGISTAIVIAICNLVKSVCELDDWDFCVYMQAVTHFRKNKEFDKSELVSWFPQQSSKCNMHNLKWSCKHMNNDDTCSMLEDTRLDDAINSLRLKGMLKESINEGKYELKFKY